MSKNSVNSLTSLLGQCPNMPDRAEFPYNRIIRVNYDCDEAGIRDLLPPGFDLSDGAKVSFMYRFSKNLDWITGGRLCAFGMSVEANCPHGTEKKFGTYWPALWENLALPVAAGREFMGVGKIVAEITEPYCVDDVWKVLLSDAGKPLMELTFRQGSEVDAGTLAAMNERAANAHVLGYMNISNPNGKGSAIQYPTCYHSPNHFEQAWGGVGEVVVYDADPAYHHWSGRTVQAIRNLPIGPSTGAFMTIGYGAHKVSEGLRLETV